MEPLLRKFNTSDGIKPIILNPGDDEEVLLTNLSYADDITVICENIEGINNVIAIYERFSKISGVKLNIPKTEIMIIGRQTQHNQHFRIMYNQQPLVITSQNSVKICGITFSNDKNIAYTENIANKILKMERQLNLWRQRNISLEGKILLVKTFGLSQLIYSLQATYIKDEDIKKIENIVYKFIWNISPTSSRTGGRIKRSSLQSNKLQGGLNSPNILALNDAIKYKIFLRSITTDHPVKNIVLSQSPT
jgi:hypothetical protein